MDFRKTDGGYEAKCGKWLAAFCEKADGRFLVEEYGIEKSGVYSIRARSEFRDDIRDVAKAKEQANNRRNSRL